MGEGLDQEIGKIAVSRNRHRPAVGQIHPDAGIVVGVDGQVAIIHHVGAPSQVDGVRAQAAQNPVVLAVAQDGVGVLGAFHIFNGDQTVHKVGGIALAVQVDGLAPGEVHPDTCGEVGVADEVGAAAPVHAVGAAFPGEEDVVAPVAHQGVEAGTPGKDIGLVVADEFVRIPGAVDILDGDVGIPFGVPAPALAREQVDHHPGAVDQVPVKENGVAAFSAVEPVRALVADEDIVPVPGIHMVVSGTGKDHVVALARGNPVVAFARTDDVLAVARGDGIGGRARGHGHVAVVRGEIHRSRVRAHEFGHGHEGIAVGPAAHPQIQGEFLGGVGEIQGRDHGQQGVGTRFHRLAGQQGKAHLVPGHKGEMAVLVAVLGLGHVLEQAQRKGTVLVLDHQIIVGPGKDQVVEILHEVEGVLGPGRVLVVDDVGAGGPGHVDIGTAPAPEGGPLIPGVEDNEVVGIVIPAQKPGVDPAPKGFGPPGGAGTVIGHGGPPVPVVVGGQAGLPQGGQVQHLGGLFGDVHRVHHQLARGHDPVGEAVGGHHVEGRLFLVGIHIQGEENLTDLHVDRIVSVSGKVHDPGGVVDIDDVGLAVLAPVGEGDAPGGAQVGDVIGVLAVAAGDGVLGALGQDKEIVLVVARVAVAARAVRDLDHTTEGIVLAQIPGDPVL